MNGNLKEGLNGIGVMLFVLGMLYLFVHLFLFGIYSAATLDKYLYGCRPYPYSSNPLCQERVRGVEK